MVSSAGKVIAAGGEHRPSRFPRRDASRRQRRSCGRAWLRSGPRGCAGRRARRNVELEIAADADARRAERGKTLAVLRRARQAKIEPSQQRLDRLGKPAPAGKRPFRHASVDEDHRHAAVRDAIRSCWATDPDSTNSARSGPPIVQETVDEGRHVERDELMERARRQPLCRERRRRHGSGRDKDGETAGTDARDQRQHCGEFADARPMHPYQGTGRARCAWHAPPFGDPIRALLAAPTTALEQGGARAWPRW